MRAYSAADGSLKWQLDLPSENGSYQIADTAFRFAADGRTVYVGTSLPGNPNAPDQYSYLYAIDTGGSAPPPSNQPPILDPRERGRHARDQLHRQGQIGRELVRQGHRQAGHDGAGGATRSP